MSELNGNLEDFPLPDVLRLLGKSRKTGVLHVYGDDSKGRVYLEDGRVSYATTRAGDDFADVDHPERRSGDRRRIELGDIKDRNPEQFQDHLKSQVIEVLVRLGRESSGSFVFQNGITPSEPVKDPFTIEDLLSDAEAELKEWNRIEDIIGTTATPMTMVQTLPSDATITIDGMAWNALAVMASSATARRVADQLGQFEIVAARALARLVEQGLVGPALETPADEPAPEPVELSEVETKAVLSALTGELPSEPVTDEEQAPDVEDVDDEPGAWVGLGEDVAAADDDDLDDANEFDENDSAPASELARRWRNLRANPAS